MPDNIINISVTGPESTGKTSLSKELAVRLGGYYVREFAREYLAQKGKNYSQSDLEIIGRTQSELISEAVKEGHSYVICDTDMTVLKIWSLVKFGNVSESLQQVLGSHAHDLYLLCYPDIDWQEDDLRENPNDRNVLFALYEQELRDSGKNFGIIRGKGEERIENALQLINDYIKSKTGRV